MTDNKKYEVTDQTMVDGETNEEARSVRNITLNLDLRQIRKPGTYVLETVDEVTSTVHTFTLNFTSAHRVCNRIETPEEKNQRVEKQKETCRAKKYKTLISTFEGCATSGRADLSEMARLGNVSTRSIRRYIREFSNEFSLKKNCVTRLKGVQK